MHLTLLCVLAAVAMSSAQLYDVAGLDSILSDVEAQVPTLTEKVELAVATMQQAATSASDAMATSVGTVSDAYTQGAQSKSMEIDILAADIKRQAITDLPAFIAGIQAGITNRVAQQAASRQGVTASIQAVVAADSMGAQQLAATSTIRAQFKAAASTNRYNTQSSATASVSAAIAGEAARQTADTSTQTAQIAGLIAARSNALSTSISTEASRANAACGSTIAMNAGGMAVSTTGTSDYGACLSGQTGQLYYSNVTKRVFLCSNLKWGALALTAPAFRDSTILNRKQAAVLTRMLNLGSVWTLCFRGTQQATFGTSSCSQTFHNLCNNKGPTVSIAKSTSNRIWGGYTDQQWQSRGSYVTSYESFLYRFNPTNVNNFERAALYYGSYSNAMYDTSSYCMTFGGGHDWMLDSTCKTGYTSTGSTYYFASGTGPYDSNWLGGSYSSWSLAEYEVYYMSA